jgi:glycosyltransferase involved in cell wall biosynthesis
MLTMVHNNPARVGNNMLRVDRKFHVGMQNYAAHIQTPLTTINPELAPGETIMDPVEVPCAEISYRVITIKTDAALCPLPSESSRLRDEISRSSLIYGTGLDSSKIARELGIPYIPILEHDLQTRMAVVTSGIKGMRRNVRRVRCVWHHLTGNIPEIRKAHSLHCNGYPVYDATRRYNANSLLFLDSRMSADMIISPEDLATRLTTRTERPLRMLFSGRYERIKGTADAVRVAVECIRRGLNIEMDFYGQGNLRDEMITIAAQSLKPERIRIHDSVPYTELVKISKAFDLFVCCHIQSDPSCTYLESFGAGLPIVGYANRMWRRLSEASGAGFASPMGHPEKVADDVERLLSAPDLVSTMSEMARGFAARHCFELEAQKRIDALNNALS